MTYKTWNKITDDISYDISLGRLSPGDQLPTKTQLASRYKAGRHSVRRALYALAREGKISIQQGRGTFVLETQRLTYQIGKRTRLRRNLIPQGVNVSSVLISADRISAPEHVAKALLLNSGAKVIESQRITSANELPVAFGSAYHCSERFPDFAERRDVLGSTTETYRRSWCDCARFNNAGDVQGGSIAFCNLARVTFGHRLFWDHDDRGRLHAYVWG